MATAATTALLAGPTQQERKTGVSTSIPTGTALLHLTVTDGLATVDLSKGFTSGGGSASMMMRVAQIVYTETQFPTVQRVRFRVEGKPLTVLGGEGLILDRPQTRADWEASLPPILVSTPWIGQTISRSFRVAGTANVFEGTVSIRIVTADGKVLMQSRTMASCGTGCRGGFSKLGGFPRRVEQTGVRGGLRGQHEGRQRDQPRAHPRGPRRLGSPGSRLCSLGPRGSAVSRAR